MLKLTNLQKPLFKNCLILLLSFSIHVFKIMAALVNSGTCNLRTCKYLADRAGPDVAAVALLLHNDGGCVELKYMT